jgi:tRNA (cmo5U34)-methyltransferase
MDTTKPYRWNSTEAVRAYDAAAPTIHPLYDEVKRRVVDALPFAADAEFSLVDLGGGSGRLLERVLERFGNARAVLVDQSEPFLAVAEERLEQFGSRVVFVQQRLQDDWFSALPERPQAIVSTSAIHHLEPVEKQQLYSKCYEALAPGGVFINGDEFRPVDDADYLAALQRWSAHMTAALAEGRIPATFQSTLDHWHQRNIREFGMPHKSGDDCHETAAAQIAYLRAVGFQDVRVDWQSEMWGILSGRLADAD